MTKNQPELKACELLPCPFCGTTNNADQIEVNDFQWFQLTCKKCAMTTGASGTKELVIERWNARPSPIIPEDAVTREDTACDKSQLLSSSTSSEPVTGDALLEAIAAAQEEISYCYTEIKGVTDHKVGYGGMTYKQLETLVTHAIKGQIK